MLYGNLKCLFLKLGMQFYIKYVPHCRKYSVDTSEWRFPFPNRENKQRRLSLNWSKTPNREMYKTYSANLKFQNRDIPSKIGRSLQDRETIRMVNTPVLNMQFLAGKLRSCLDLS